MLFHVNETSGLDVCGARLKGDWAVGVGGEKIWPPGLVCDTVWWPHAYLRYCFVSFDPAHAYRT